MNSPLDKFKGDWQVTVLDNGVYKSMPISDVKPSYEINTDDIDDLSEKLKALDQEKKDLERNRSLTNEQLSMSYDASIEFLSPFE